MAKKIAFKTLGCRVNLYETDAIASQFKSAGYDVVDNADGADIYVVNTCTVTNQSDQKCRQAINQIRRAHPDAVIAAVGCMVNHRKQEMLASGTIDLAIDNERKYALFSIIDSYIKGEPTDPEGLDKDLFSYSPAYDTFHTRSLIKIHDGCNNFCSYCIIPYARGPIRSRSMESIERELRSLAARGFSEVVLTGIHLASYGREFAPDAEGRRPDLVDVLRLANGIDGLRRIRLGSLEPKFCDARFAEEAAALPKLCRQFHLSLQSGSDTVLRRMNRKYTTAEYREAVRLLRQTMPDCAVTTDVIAGFVGETEREHRETMAFVEEIGFARIHVFPYSRRPGTRADAMEGHLEKQTKEARAAALIALGHRLETAFVERQIGTEQEILLEDDGTGYTGNYVRVRAAGNEGEIRRVRIVGREDTTAIGEECTNE